MHVAHVSSPTSVAPQRPQNRPMGPAAAAEGVAMGATGGNASAGVIGTVYGSGALKSALLEAAVLDPRLDRADEQHDHDDLDENPAHDAGGIHHGLHQVKGDEYHQPGDRRRQRIAARPQPEAPEPQGHFRDDRGNEMIEI